MLNEKEATLEAIDESIKGHMTQITQEFKEAFEFMKKYPKSVTIFGSSRLTKESSHYRDAKRLAARIVNDLHYAVITGGGPGIMEAANWGAKEAGGESIGLNIVIPNEQHTNSYTNHNLKFNYFFSRKTMLEFSAEAYIFLPGGFGTFDELFGILTLLQTNKTPRVPIILYGKDFWNPFKDFLTKNMVDQHHTIDPEDLNLFTITDSIDETLRIITAAPVSPWWNMFD